MYISKKRGGSTAVPIEMKLGDSIETKLVKNLVTVMTAYEPNDRPSIDDVLAELHTIKGMLSHK